MNDEELKKKLAVLKSAPVPKSYWENYWPRLSPRLSNAPVFIEDKSMVGVTLRWAVPVFAAVMMGLAGYWVGLQKGGYASAHAYRNSSQPQAERVFHEMLALFPNRINWISYVDGKVDFSVSAEAHTDSKALIPLVITLPHAKDVFEARLLIRSGESASAAGPWDKEMPVFIQMSLSPDGTKAHISCRLNDAAGIETEVAVNKKGLQPLGSFFWKERLIQVSTYALGRQRS